MSKSVLPIGLTLGAIVALANPPEAKAAGGIDGYVWYIIGTKYGPASGTKVEVINQKNGKVVATTYATGISAAYYTVANLPAGQYSVRATYTYIASNGKKATATGTTCCGQLNGTHFPNGYYARLNVNVKGPK